MWFWITDLSEYVIDRYQYWGSVYIESSIYLRKVHLTVLF